jgi:hypothetical protein
MVMPGSRGQSFFLMREGTLREFEAAMASLDQPVEAYLAQLNSIQTRDTRSRLKTIEVPTWCWRGRTTSSSP